MDDSSAELSTSRKKKKYHRVLLDDSSFSNSPADSRVATEKKGNVEDVDQSGSSSNGASFERAVSENSEKEEDESSGSDGTGGSVEEDSEPENSVAEDSCDVMNITTPITDRSACLASTPMVRNGDKERGDNSMNDVTMQSVASIVIESDDEDDRESVPSVVEDSCVEILSEPVSPNGIPADGGMKSDEAEKKAYTFRTGGGVSDTAGATKDDQKQVVTAKMLSLQEALEFSNKLPDKGVRIQSELKSVQKEIYGGREEMNGGRDVGGGGDAAMSTKMSQQAVGSQSVASAFPAGGDTATAAVGFGDGAKYGGAKPKSTILLDQWEVKRNEEYWKTNYAAGGVANRLYGGKMTEARQMEAKIVTQDAIKHLHSAITTCPAEVDETKDPPGLLVPLLEHQKQALTWLVWRESQQPSGGILADDMGLGKTLTMISLILQQRTRMSKDDDCRKRVLENKKLIPSRANLVVCPVSVMHQWEKEIEHRVKPGKLSVLLYHGQKRETNAHRLARYDVVLTTYGTVASEIGEKKSVKEDSDDEEDSMSAKSTWKKQSSSPLMNVAWERIILDEAHQIRNHTTAQSQACCKLPATSRWALTGTPLQNQLKDLYSLLKFIRYSPFDELAVWKEWVETKTDAAKQRLNTIVKGILLRRTKEQTSATTGKALVTLPPKRFDTEILDFTTVEGNIYQKMFSASQIYVANFLDNKFDRDVKTFHVGADRNDPMANPFKTGPGRFDEAEDASKKGTGGLAILVMLLRLRQACVHFALTKEAIDIDTLSTCGVDSEPTGDLIGKFNDMSLLEDDESEKGAGDSGKAAVEVLFEDFTLSTKIKAVLECLDHFRASHTDGYKPKFVLVSQWVKVLDILAVHLKKRRIVFTSITGKVGAQDRSQRIDEFNNLRGGPEVMLLSLTAGGVGVNLVGGNHLFVIDLHWNPALEKQCCDRIYRVGQTRPTFIHKFIMKGSIEQSVQALQESKLKLAENVLSGTGSKQLNKLTLHDLKFLFGLTADVAPRSGK